MSVVGTAWIFRSRAVSRLHANVCVIATKRQTFLSTSARLQAKTVRPPPPTTRQLRIVALRQAIPMIGFGFMDNLVMIQAGEAIDASLGVTFGLSTLTAAGFGQCVSDVVGFTSGGVVDAAVGRFHLPHHGLSSEQLDAKQARIYGTVGGCVGVVIGCLLGMMSLLFMDLGKAERAKKAKELTSIFESVVDEGYKLVDADRAALWMLDSNEKELWTQVATGTEKVFRVAKSEGIVGACVQSGEIVNVPDAYKDSRFNKEVDKNTGFRTTSILAVPLRDDDGKTIGVIEFINKRAKEGSNGVFGVADEKLAIMLASHVTAFIRIVHTS